jgi:hypothetical protein
MAQRQPGLEALAAAGLKVTLAKGGLINGTQFRPPMRLGLLRAHGLLRATW